MCDVWGRSQPLFVCCGVRMFQAKKNAHFQPRNRLQLADPPCRQLPGHPCGAGALRPGAKRLFSVSKSLNKHPENDGGLGVR